MTSDRVIKGSCMCGAVRYEATGPFRPIVACHCAECRKSTGNYLTASAAYRKNVRLIADEELKWYQSGAETERGFCSACGSSLFFRRIGGDRISFSGGSVDGPTGLEMAGHIFAAEKGDYYSLDHEALVHQQDAPELIEIPS
ncbi:MAG: GFA family protein [Pseudomonadota bacterium]